MSFFGPISLPVLNEASAPIIRSALQRARVVGKFAVVQAVVQVIGFFSGILLIRHLDQREYAYFTIANTMQGTLNTLADIGISVGLVSIGGRVWQDRNRFGQLIKTASNLRRKLGAIAALVITPILFFMLVKNGAPIPYTLVLIALVLAGLAVQLSLGVLGVVPRLRSDIGRIQTIDLVGASARLLVLVALMFLFLSSAVAAARVLPRAVDSNRRRVCPSDLTRQGKSKCSRPGPSSFPFVSKFRATARLAAARTRPGEVSFMRTRKRIHPYVTPELAHRLTTYCAAKGITESAAVQAAVEDHLDGEAKDNEVIIRRLDRLGRASLGHQRDLALMTESFGLFLRMWFAFVPQMAEGDKPAADSLSARRYRQFVDSVSKQLATGDGLRGSPDQESSWQRGTWCRRGASGPSGRRKSGGSAMSHHSGDTPDRSDFNPRMGRRNREREPTLKRAVIQRLASMASRWTPGGAGARPTHQRARHDMRPMPALSRRCVVKARYVQMRAGGDKAARRHLAYIERDGVEQDGSKGRLFDRTGDVDRAAFGAEIAGEQRQFRFIVSPEDGNDLDLRDYTNRLMQRMEKDLGRELRWAAVCHYNTDNPHVHVVVRGRRRRRRRGSDRPGLHLEWTAAARAGTGHTGARTADRVRGATAAHQ